MAIAGAVAPMTLAAGQAASGVAARRAMRDTSLDAGSRGFALWTLPLYQNIRGFGLETGQLDYGFRGNLGGVAIGADKTFENGLRLGVAAHIGGGEARSTGDVRRTKNRATFGGAGLYASWARGPFALSGDVTYTSTRNRLTQKLPSGMGMADLKSTVRGHAGSASLEAQWHVPVAGFDVAPHLGARATVLRMDDHTLKSGGTVAKAEGDTTTIVTIPAGVRASREITLENGMRIKPMVDLGVTAAAGDRKVKSRVRFTGVERKVTESARIMDRVTGGGMAGLEIGRGDVSASVAYSGQFGKKTSAQGVALTLRWEF